LRSEVSGSTDINFYFADMLQGAAGGNESCPSPPPLNTDLCIQNCTREELLKSKVKFIYENVIYPKNLPVLLDQTTTLESVFAPSIKGRFDPLGTFRGYEELKEYFFALGASPILHALSVDFVDLFASGDEVFVRVNIFLQRYDITNPTNPVPTTTLNATQLGRFLFDSNDLVITTDLMIHNLAGALDPVDAAGKLYNIQTVCALLKLYPGNCNSTTDPAGYYTDFQDCVTYMSSINFGSWANAASDTFVCRWLHSILTLYDPFLHCPHAGKTGGGKCVYFPYASYYEESF